MAGIQLKGNTVAEVLTTKGRTLVHSSQAEQRKLMSDLTTHRTVIKEGWFSCYIKLIFIDDF